MGPTTAPDSLPESIHRAAFSGPKLPFRSATQRRMADSPASAGWSDRPAAASCGSHGHRRGLLARVDNVRRLRVDSFSSVLQRDSASLTKAKSESEKPSFAGKSFGGRAFFP